MLTHGFNPDDLLRFTIISIHKDSRGSMCSSDNYRGISLSNSILCQLFDYVFIHTHKHSLQTCDLQFGFKSNHWGRLFKILIERKVSFLCIRLLLDSDLRQLSCVSCGFFKSRYFSLSNGVKQGGVLSPILSSFYIDKLLIRLKHAHIGYHMNNIFA